ncbi:unnamed protein product [Microthlaspi erraticum]|uniref:FKB95-like N-terminal Kelch domain-containing protein n=1 Tax=Microthlaspi erraticum TaxID=1685480 RepID=A0A6D2HVY8_9BRAS|nr:unnamed protein product [Microthlaspi erraticum]
MIKVKYPGSLKRIYAEIALEKRQNGEIWGTLEWAQSICCVLMGSIDLLWVNGLDRSVVCSCARSICCGLMGSIDLLWAPGLDRPVGLIDLFLVGQNSPWNVFIVELDGKYSDPNKRPDSSRRVLVPISSPNISSTLSMSGVAVVGPNIYVIGSGSRQDASSSVMVMDSRSHTWLEAPSMRVAHVLPSVCALDGKICVTGGCDNLDSRNWMEIFDTETQTWEFLQIPSEEIFSGSEYMSVKYEGTLYVRSV